jgi:uncharacterized protein (TIGR02001 family)
MKGISMKITKMALCATAAAFAFGGAAMAQDAAPTGPTLAFNAGVANEYIFRGLSQSAGDPQVFAGADVSYGKFYAGVWGSNVEFGDGTNEEFDIYGGFKPEALGINWDLGLIYYGYIRDPDNSEDYWEAKVAGSRAVGPVTVGGAFFYSPEFPLNTGKAFYYEANASYAITDKLTVSGAFGHQELDEDKYGLDSYNTWNLGLTYPLTSKVTIDGRYIDTDSDAHDFFPDDDKAPFNTGAKFIATLKASF